MWANLMCEFQSLMCNCASQAGVLDVKVQGSHLQLSHCLTSISYNTSKRDMAELTYESAREESACQSAISLLGCYIIDFFLLLGVALESPQL